MSKRTKVFSRLVAVIVFSMALLPSRADNQEKLEKTEPGFAIYESTAQLTDYGRGPQWEAFYQKGALTKLLVSDPDIEAYDWDDQAIILTEAASKRIQNTLGRFIVTLGDKRLYGGTGIKPICEVAFMQPVIYTESIAARTVLIIRTQYPGSNGRLHLDDKNWGIVASPAVMDHFAALGKLKHASSEEPSNPLLKNVQRILLQRGYGGDLFDKLDR